MNLLKDSWLFGLAVVPVLVAGLFFALQPNVDKDTTINPLPPSTFTPGDPGSGSPSIIPGDRDTTKIEYRNIVFSRDSGERAFGWAEESGVAHREFLYIPGDRLVNKMEII